MAYRSARRALSLAVLLLAGTAAACRDEPTEPRPQPTEKPALSRVPLSNGVVETYHAVGDTFLVAGYELSEEWWDGISAGPRKELQGYLDRYLPPTFKDMGHRGADEMMRSFGESFFAARDPVTGLVPFLPDSFVVWANGNTGGRQPVGVIARAVEFATWFPDDASMVGRARELVDATIRAVDQPGAGIWGWAEATPGHPRLGPAHPSLTGWMIRGLTRLSQITGDQSYQQWADQKAAYFWSMASGPGNVLICGDPLPNGLQPVDGGLCTTDMLYYTKQQYAVWRINGNTTYRDQALATTDVWNHYTWHPGFGHFIRKLKPDMSHFDQRIYGDAKYNTLRVLLGAYQATGNRVYLERLKEAWRGLVRLGGGTGLSPDAVTAGVMLPERGYAPNQANFLLILLDAYALSGDTDLLRDSEALARAILADPAFADELIEGRAGDSFLRLAIQRRPIRRLEVDLGSSGARVRVMEGDDVALEVAGPRRIAVIYLPEDAQVRLEGGAKTRSTRRVTLTQLSEDY